MRTVTKTAGVVKLCGTRGVTSHVAVILLDAPSDWDLIII